MISVKKVIISIITFIYKNCQETDREHEKEFNMVKNRVYHLI